MANKILEIDIDRIRKNPDNELIFNMDNLDVLANNIKEVGFVGAIDVIENPDGYYEILSGHRRYEAALLLGMKTIPVHIETVSDDIEKAKKLIRLNVNNRDLNALDKARSIQYYIDNVLVPSGFKGNTQEEVASVFGISVTQVKYLRRILTYPEPIQHMIENGMLPYSGLVDLVNFNDEELKEAEVLLSNAIDNNPDGLSKKETLLIVGQIKKRHKLEESLQKEKERYKPLEDLSISHNKNINTYPNAKLNDIVIATQPKEDSFMEIARHGFEILADAFDNIPDEVSYRDRTELLTQIETLLTKLHKNEH